MLKPQSAVFLWACHEGSLTVWEVNQVERGGTHLETCACSHYLHLKGDPFCPPMNSAQDLFDSLTCLLAVGLLYTTSRRSISSQSSDLFPNPPTTYQTSYTTSKASLTRPFYPSSNFGLFASPRVTCTFQDKA